jgi:hypothetical protein
VELLHAEPQQRELLRSWVVAVVALPQPCCCLQPVDLPGRCHGCHALMTWLKRESSL